MQFGVAITAMLQQPTSEDMAKRLDDALERVRLARELGFSFVAMGQHYLTQPYQMLQTVPVLARVAAEVPDMGLLATIVLPLHHPVDVAEQFATLDIISRGKAILSVALGYRDEEFNAFSVDRRTRAGRFEEALTLLRRLWTEESVTFHGRFFQLEGARMTLRPVQKPHPPIWVAANNDVAIQRAARLGLPWYINPHAAFDTVQRQVEMYRQTSLASGHPVPSRLPIHREMYIAPDRESAFQDAAVFLGGKYNAYAQWGQDRALPGQERFGTSFNELAQDRFIVGSPQDALEAVGRFTSLGISHMTLRMQWPGMAPAMGARSMRLFAKEVMPHFS
ncbi:MAG: LLM class flavin-dependent oxidoreductase [Chloroflexi bacterium]|nr:LLM class flavin-dependent oxidoreductase [Chloroflexota bacterium]